ncbi:MAG TPA: type II toxin-antitoxin system VapC family toxin [Terracidiphilus sp.]|jgi:predicted nucleic acid-binding protein
MYLLDTNVVSELRKVNTSKADRRVKAWAKNTPATSMFLSDITVLELERETLLLERRDALRGAMLRSWLEKIVFPAFAGRILPIDTPVALRCATLHVPNPRSYRDSLIAATAMVHRMTIVTRNVSDFQPTGVALLNPWRD